MAVDLPSSPTMSAVAAYIADEITTNSTSPQATEIKLLLTRAQERFKRRIPDIVTSNAARHKVPQPGNAFMNFSGIPGFNAMWDSQTYPIRRLFSSLSFDDVKAIVNEYTTGVSEIATAFKMFYDAVKSDAVWDHKRYLNDKGTWYNHTDGYSYYFDIWANLHYGYIGRYVGFHAAILLEAAGLAQVGSDLRTKSGFRNLANKMIALQVTPGVQTFQELDNQGDQLSIRLGIELFRRHPTPNANLTSEIVAMVETARWGSEQRKPTPRFRPPLRGHTRDGGELWDP